MHVLITGGLGFIGHRVGLELLARGAQITIVDLPAFGDASLPSAAIPPQGGPVEIVLADVRQAADWGHRLADVDVVIHCAGVHQADEVAADVAGHIDVNVAGTRSLLDATVAAGVGRFIYLSSAKVYGQIDGRASQEDDLVAPIDVYALGKAVAEIYCDRYATNHSLEVSVIRPFSVYGPGQDTHTGYMGALLEALRRSRRVILPGGPDTSRDFVHIDTVVDVCVSAALSVDAPPPILNAGSGVPTSLAELVEAFQTASGRDLEVTYRDPRPGTLVRTLADVSLMTDFSCPTLPPLQMGIQETTDAQLGMP